MTFAIDFGTSNTVITRWNSATQVPEVISLPGLAQKIGQNPPLVPSLAYIKDAAAGSVQIGQQVRDRGLDVSSDRRFFRNFKRGIGTSIQGFLPELDGQTVSFEQIGSWFLTEVIATLQTREGTADALVFTVPVDSFEVYRNWLGQTCEALDLQQVRMLDEPTAAALGYGIQQEETVLVMDFGGGTLDFSLVELAIAADRKPLGFILRWGNKSLAESSSQKPQRAKVLAKAGENLGGADIDNWLADYFHEQQGIGVTPLTQRLVERLKIQLSDKAQATESFFDDETLDSLTLKLDRATFEDILRQRQFFERLDGCMEQILQQGRRQGISIQDIDAVLLVGGTAQIPAVQQWLAGYFPSEKIRGDRPFTAVAEGALQVQQGIELTDFLYHSYGIRYWDRRNRRHGWQPIIRSGQPYPSPAPVEMVLGASTDNQPSIELVIGELGNEDALVTTEVFFEGDRLVTRQTQKDAQQIQPLNDTGAGRTIAKLDPLGVPGSDRIRVQFAVDGDRTLRITVDDILTGDTLVENRPVVQLS
ncbi:Hsp70 family protein [Leptolyngbya iicbica]|uniref:Hsp70 family protein n=2 Tax=Cyanophyceae TaxID=3028117 RepID=A0A4Q7EF68_9CYAN|nr:Hsp70 family protein [Leptolyngbya sp. LK]RZM81863.1 Hsp70 family protein [Leptolyngbya sp. LK]